MTSLRDVMAKDPVTTGPDATVAEAAATMVRGRVGSLLVKDDDSVVGILTERDVLRAAGADGDLLSTRVLDWMTADPTTAPADQDTEDAIATMLESGFRHLPVVEGSELVGIVSLRALLGGRVDTGAQPVEAPKAPKAPKAPRAGKAERAETADPAPESSPSQVQERRERMFEVTRTLQRRSRPPEGDVDGWRRQLAEAVEQVQEVVAAHIADTEGTGGFFQELVQESGGRLQAATRRLHRDHERSTALVVELQEALDANAEPTELSQAADELFAQLEAHRHRGSDLLWQAYGVEIGGGD